MFLSSFWGKIYFMAETVLEAKNLTKVFDDFTAVDNVSFSLKEGEVLGFLGPNGAGKSTTIHMLLGLLTPTVGEIRIFGKDLAKHRVEILQNANFSSAYVSLPHTLTVRENLLVFAKIYSVKNPNEKIDSLLETFGVSSLKNILVRHLSAGQKTRVHLCKALINDPKLLLLDEPLSSLDPDIVDQTLELFEKLKKLGTTILYATHSMGEVERLADNVVFINHGKIIAQGHPLELTQKILQLEAVEPNLEQVFLKVIRTDR